MVSKTERVLCPNCQKKIAFGNLAKHQKTKKCKNYNDKTAGKNAIVSSHKPQIEATVNASIPAEISHSKILTEINLKSEFDKNMEKLNPKKNTGKEKKYQCGVCNATFDNLNEGKCPDCGEQLQ